jgi:anti-sigma B factor antagonist
MIGTYKPYLLGRVIRFTWYQAYQTSTAEAVPKGVVMVIRVAAKDVGLAKHLVVGLVGLFGGECVSLRADGEVQVRPHAESNRALVQTLDAFEHWLEETRTDSADVLVDERPYMVYRARSLSRSRAPSERPGLTSQRLQLAGSVSSNSITPPGLLGRWRMTNLALPREPEVLVARVPGEISVISLLGAHDIATVWEVRNAIALALEQGTHLVVDLSETEFIDSSIAHALVDSEQFASERGLRISLQLQTHDSVKRLLEISGLDALPIYGTRAEAIDAVRQMPNRMTERSAAGIGSRTTTVERRERWGCSWL